MPTDLKSTMRKAMASHQSDATTSKTPSATTTRTLPHIPVELWGEIIGHVDDPFDLWISCRQVSRSFRHEAELAFRQHLLPESRMGWFCAENGVYIDLWALLDTTCNKQSPSGPHFELFTFRPYTSVTKPTSPGFASTSNRDRALWKILDREDIHALRPIVEFSGSARRGAPFHSMIVSFKNAGSFLYFVNDIELPLH
jgi:hypothetical protein